MLSSYKGGIVLAVPSNRENFITGKGKRVLTSQEIILVY
jgi:hypothetical protein